MSAMLEGHVQNILKSCIITVQRLIEWNKINYVTIFIIYNLLWILMIRILLLILLEINPSDQNHHICFLSRVKQQAN